MEILTIHKTNEGDNGNIPEGKSRGEKPQVIFPKEYCHYLRVWFEYCVFLSLGELNKPSLFSAEWLPRNMGFYSPLQYQGYSIVTPLEKK